MNTNVIEGSYRYWLVSGFEPQFKIHSGLPGPPTVDQIYEVAPHGHVDMPDVIPSVTEMTTAEFYSEEYDVNLWTTYL